MSVVDIFLSAKFITENNRNNVFKLVNKVENKNLKKELTDKINTQKKKAKFKHHKSQVE